MTYSQAFDLFQVGLAVKVLGGAMALGLSMGLVAVALRRGVR